MALHMCSRFGRLSATKLFMNLQARLNIPNGVMDEILRATRSILPRENSFPGTHVQAKKNVRSMLLEWQKIDCCRNGCCVYYGETADLDTCPVHTCNAPRYKIGINNTRRPFAVLFYLPIIPRLLRRFMQPEYAKMIT